MMCCQLTALWIIAISSACVQVCAAQETCYPPGGVAGIVVATIIVTFVVGGLGVALAWRRWTRKTGAQNSDQNHHGHQKQNQKTHGDFAFDNPYFSNQEDGTDGLNKGKARSSLNKNSIRSSKISEYSVKTKKPRNGKGHFMFGGGKKHRAYDDSCLAVEPERTVVSLRGHDFTGLGFNICGNMRDGIMVKDVLHRGPASESGLIKAGDKILNVTVSFTNIVYEDALTILSYASPYDVQLEIERIPDKSRSTPSGSKRLGSCSFNTSGQKLFHPLYRSQSIDDLTKIDRDTFPSHGIGPRRSQSIGVAAHKLAAHFKSSDSKLEDKERSPMSLVLSTTGSLNEKMLANVMSDGNLHKNGLQWEKRFEDTLESEDSGNVSGKRSAGNDVKANGGSTSVTKSTTSSVESKSNATTPQSYRQKNSKYLDSPYGKEKLEIHKSPLDKSDIDGSVSVQVHQPERSSGRRAKTMAQASSALWQLDQSIRDDDIEVSNVDSTLYNQRNALQKDNLTHSATSRFTQREEGNESDVSKDSLELSGNQHSGRKSKQAAASEIKSTESPSSSALNKQYQPEKKHGTPSESIKITGKATETSSNCHSERVYANNVINKSMTAHSSPVVGGAEHRLPRDKTYLPGTKLEGTHRENEGAVYSNHRDITTRDGPHRNSPSLANERQKPGNPDNFTQNFVSKSRITVNGETNENKQQNSSLHGDYKTHQSGNQRNDIDTRPSENRNKSNPVPQQVFMKKTANPAGMFTQINPFQMPTKQKNVNLKPWVGREDISKQQSPINTTEVQQPRSNYVTISDSTSQLNRRTPVPDTHSYGQRMNDRSKTVLMSSYESSPYGSIHNSQSSNYKQHH